MLLEVDGLKCVTVLTCNGIDKQQAECLVQSFSEFDFRNIYSKSEINQMLCKTVEDVIRQNRRELILRAREFDKNFKKQEQEMEKKAQEMKEQRLELRQEIEKQFQELKETKRWIIGTVITVGLGLAGYLSALFHLMR